MNMYIFGEVLWGSY